MRLLQSRSQLFVSLLAVCVLFPSYGKAQVTSAQLDGTVTDGSGAVIPQANVQIVNTDTGITRTVTTGKSGGYSAPLLPPGHYRLTVEHPGFQTMVVGNITLNIGDAKQMVLPLKVGQATQEVTVDGSGLTINTTDASVSTLVDRKFIENIPLNGRSFQDLISMTPGIVTQSPQSDSSLGNNGDFSVNGQRTESNYYTVDGVAANGNAGDGSGFPGAGTAGALPGSTALGTTQALISVDALQEFRVESSTYSAEYGRSPGGQFSFTTRSGTNHPHGSVFDYLRNNYFDANDWFNDHYGDSISPLRQNDFGGTLGAPVWLPKIYDGRNKTFFFASYEGLRLDLPQAATIAYVPDLSLRQTAAPALKPILNAFPLPTANGLDYSSGLAQFIKGYSLPSHIDSTSVRIDQVLGAHSTLFFRFGDTPSTSESRALSAVTRAENNSYTYTVGVTSQISKSTGNEFRLGYVRSEASQTANLDSFGGAQPINLAEAMGVGGYPHAEPVFELDNPSVGESGLAVPATLNRQRQWNLVDTVSYSHGRHELRAGIDYRRIKSPLSPYSPLAESIFYGSSLYSSVASNQSYETVVYQTLASTPQFNETAVFIQDDWRVVPRLSLSMGLRWEVDPPPTGADGNDAYTLLGSISDPSTLALAPKGTPLWKTTWYNLAPRLGAAWLAHTTPGWETVFRTGGGVFFDTDNQEATNGFSGIGFNAASVYLGSPLPLTKSQLAFSPSTEPPFTSDSAYAFPSHLQLPYTLQWNVSVQQAMGRTQAFTVSYVGANGRRLVAQQELDVSSLNPNFGVVSYFTANLTSSYQAMQLQYQRTVATGVHALAAYTWSHSIDYGSQDAALPVQRGNSDFDVRNNFQAGATWDIPTLSSTAAARVLTSGWSLDGRAIVRSAFPIPLSGNFSTVPDTGQIYYGNVNYDPSKPLYIYGSQYPGGRALNGGPNVSAGTAALTLPATGELGDAPRNFVRGFGATQFNTAARREFHLYRELNLQFRAEVFNVLNHPNFGYVDHTLTDATFGEATKMLNASLGTMASQYQQGGARSMQFALKLQF